MLLRRPSEERLSQLLAEESPSENRSGKFSSLVFRGPEIEFFLLVDPGSGAQLLPALQQRPD